LQTAARHLDLNTARIRDVELLTDLEFLRDIKPAQDAVRMRVHAPDSIW